MSKLVRILAVILMAFALSSLFLYRLRLSNPRSSPPTSGQQLLEETKTVEGEIQAVDSDAKTLTLTNADEELMLAFDERTSVLESGKPIQPSSIASGTPATVKYTQRGNKKWARRIEIVVAEPPDSYNSY